MYLIVTVFFLTMTISFSTYSQEKSREEQVAEIMREQNKQAGIVPEEGFVPTLDVAVEIATAILQPIFGKELKKEIPLRGRREGSVWIIEGRKRKGCAPDNKDCMTFDQSPVYVEIDAKEGKILKVIKYK